MSDVYHLHKKKKKRKKDCVKKWRRSLTNIKSECGSQMSRTTDQALNELSKPGYLILDIRLRKKRVVLESQIIP